MRRRHVNTQVFGLSFLDLAFCALGGVILLLLYSINRHQEEAGRFLNTTLALQGEVDSGKNKVDGLLDENDKTRAELDRWKNKYDEDTKKLKDDLDRANEKYAAAEGKLNQKIAQMEDDLKQANEKLKGVVQESEKQRSAYDKQLTGLRGEHDKTVADLQGQIARIKGDLTASGKELQQLRGEHTDLHGEIARIKGDLAASDGKLQRLRGQISGVIGLKGRMENIVFVFDSSYSLRRLGTAKETDETTKKALLRYEEYKDLLKAWVRNLAFKGFNVIKYDSSVSMAPGWSEKMITGLDENRILATHFIDTFEPNYTTNTMGALQTALSLPGVDTIILFSDGQPNDQDNNAVNTEEEAAVSTKWILDYLRDNNRNTIGRTKVTINTVAMGEYLNATYGKFLQDMAKENGGVFIGR